MIGRVDDIAPRGKGRSGAIAFSRKFYVTTSPLGADPKAKHMAKWQINDALHEAPLAHLRGTRAAGTLVGTEVALHAAYPSGWK